MSNDTDHLATLEKILLANLTLRGITRIEVLFDGSGDSGSIDSISVVTDHMLSSGELANLTIHTLSNPGKVWSGSAWIQDSPEEVTISLRQAIENYVNELLDRSGVDWYNDGGGWGSWTWSAPNSSDFEIYQRTVSEELVFEDSSSLASTK